MARKKTSISGQNTRIYSRFLHTVKTSLLRSAPSLDDFAPNVRPQTEIKLHFRAPSPSCKVSLLKVPNKQTTTVEFPGSANWTSIRQAVNSVPSFTIQDVLTYFIERKAEDKESNNDFKNIANSAFALFHVGHIQKIELTSDLDQVHFRCDCLPEMAIS